jgi:hypothetical protein
MNANMFSIHLIRNTVKINKTIAKALFKESERMHHRQFDSEDDAIMEDGLLGFPSHFEHSDFLSCHCGCRFKQILKKYKVKGEIRWTCHEGDYAGQSWGYRFDGKGGMKHIIKTREFWKINKDREEELGA